MRDAGKIILVLIAICLPASAKAEIRNSQIPQIEVQIVDISVPDVLLTQLSPLPVKKAETTAKKTFSWRRPPPETGGFETVSFPSPDRCRLKNRC